MINDIARESRSAKQRLGRRGGWHAHSPEKAKQATDVNAIEASVQERWRKFGALRQVAKRGFVIVEPTKVGGTATTLLKKQVRVSCDEIYILDSFDVVKELGIDAEWRHSRARRYKHFDESSLQPPLIPVVVEKPRYFIPSAKLTKYVMHLVPNQNLHAEMVVEAQDLIRNGVVRLFHTLAASVRDSGREPPYALAEGGVFADPIAKAILFRLPVGYIKAAAFFEQLLLEVAIAAKANLIRGPFWKVTADSPGVLRLVVDKLGVGAPVERPESNPSPATI